MKAKDKVWLCQWGKVRMAHVITVDGNDVMVRCNAEDTRIVEKANVYSTKQKATAATLTERVKTLRKSLADLQTKQAEIVKQLQECVEALDAAEEPTTTATITMTRAT